MNKYFSNLAVYYAWVSQLVSYLLPVERWIFVNSWLPARSCLQLMSSLVVFSFWCLWEGTLFKTTLLSSAVSQGIISLSFSPSPQHDCFDYLSWQFFFLSFSQNIRTLLLNTLQIAVQNLRNVVCLLFFFFFSFSDCFSSFYSLLQSSCIGC